MTARKRAATGAVTVACVSDTHAGGTTALCPPGVPLDDGGEYLPSKAQAWLWQCWLEYWQRVEQLREAAGGPLYVVSNGDAFEGDHHGTSQIVSRNPETQAEIARRVFAVPLALQPDKTFVVRGTEVHVGGSGYSEEALAKLLHAEPDPDTGSASRWQLEMELGGKLLQFTHHGRSGFREHTLRNAANLYAHDLFLSYVKAGERPPDLCIRGHHHRFNDSYDAAPLRVVTSGAWQFSTGFAYRKSLRLSDIGGIVIEVGQELMVHKVQFHLRRSTIWRPE